MYFRARYYDPATGEFISRDPLGYVDGMSLYRGYFVPNGVDPSGTQILIRKGQQVSRWVGGFLGNSMNSGPQCSASFGPVTKGAWTLKTSFSLPNGCTSCSFYLPFSQRILLSQGCFQRRAAVNVAHGFCLREGEVVATVTMPPGASCQSALTNNPVTANSFMLFQTTRSSWRMTANGTYTNPSQAIRATGWSNMGNTTPAPRSVMFTFRSFLYGGNCNL